MTNEPSGRFKRIIKTRLHWFNGNGRLSDEYVYLNTVFRCDLRSLLVISEIIRDVIYFNEPVRDFFKINYSNIIV